MRVAAVSFVALTAPAAAWGASGLRSAVASQVHFRGARGLSMSAADGAYGFTVSDLDSNAPVDLAKFKGSVSLVVNVASK